KVRSTLQTSESLEWQASARPNDRLWRHEQRVLATIFFRVPKFLVLFASKSTARTTTRRINDNRLRVKQTKE
ncbi:MAG: hypothetical protein IJ513_02200, partial [Bacteroidaceae bacterium]|nr:hypothetical protein [Bacteroidaceae bacterium]